MMAFESMLIDAAEQAGMKHPPDSELDNDGPQLWSPDEYPHFYVFCKVQLGVPVTWGNHWNNAKIIAGLSDGEVRTITLEGLEQKGFSP